MYAELEGALFLLDLTDCADEVKRGGRLPAPAGRRDAVVVVFAHLLGLGEVVLVLRSLGCWGLCRR